MRRLQQTSRRFSPLARLRPETAQAATEYLLLVAVIALVFASLLALWKYPIASYLNHLVQAIVKIR